MLKRELQLKMLQAFAECYPQSSGWTPDEGDSLQECAANVEYLIDHGLCTGKTLFSMSDPVRLGVYKITAAGLDFLADDGGLSAILGVVTVKLHADTVRDLMLARVDASDLPPEKKSDLKKHLANLSGLALKDATADLVKIGLDHLPNGLRWLQTLAGL